MEIQPGLLGYKSFTADAVLAPAVSGVVDSWYCLTRMQLLVFTHTRTGAAVAAHRRELSGRQVWLCTQQREHGMHQEVSCAPVTVSHKQSAIADAAPAGVLPVNSLQLVYVDSFPHLLLHMRCCCCSPAFALVGLPPLPPSSSPPPPHRSK